MSWFDSPNLTKGQTSVTSAVSLKDEKEKRDAMVKALMNYSSDMPEQKMVGRIVQPLSPFETLSKLGAAGYGAYKAGQK